MAYNEHTAERMRKILKKKTPFIEKAMFGGIAFMVRGHMTVGINKDDVMVRVGKDSHDEYVGLQGARTMDFTNKPMRGYIMVNADGYQTDKDLSAWIDRALSFNNTMAEK